MSELHLTIPGKPIAKARPRFVRMGKFVKTYNMQETEEGRFKWELLSKIGNMTPLEGPIHLTCRFFMPIPASISRKKLELYLGGAIRHIKRPDLDNLIKFVKDCANGVLWKDDSQIISLNASKAYHPDPQTEIRLDW